MEIDPPASVEAPPNASLILSGAQSKSGRHIALHPVSIADGESVVGLAVLNRCSAGLCLFSWRS